MGDKTGIEWCDATWNPVTGCDEVSPGCTNCYAKRIAERFRGQPAFPNGFDVTLRPERLDQPFRWRRPRKVFVNSMSDLFHDDVPAGYIATVFAVMALAGQHTFQVLTKRHARMRHLLNSDEFRRAVDVTAGELLPGLKPPPQPRHLDLDRGGVVWPIPNVWLGVSVESQQWADIRIPALKATPAALRFLSCEPLLEPVERLYLYPAGAPGTCYDIDGQAWHPPGTCASCAPGIDWVIVGAESGRDARPMQVEWARTIKERCVAAGVPFFLKQYADNGRKVHLPELDGQSWAQFPRERVGASS